ncbi:hypothetical protein Tco_0883030 [Tanacetum coccineum]
MGNYTHQQLKHKILEELQKLYQKEQKWINDFKPMDSEEDGSNTKKASKRIKRIADSTSKQNSPKKSKVIQEQASTESNEEAAIDYEQEKEELRIQDLMDLHRLVMKRFEDNTPEGYNLLLWGDLKVMFEPNAEDEIWIEKRYPLIKEMLKKMLNWKLEAEAESTMAFELLKFIKSQFRGGLLGIMDFYNLVLLIQLDTAGDVPLDLSKDTKPYIKQRSSRSVHWDHHVPISIISDHDSRFTSRFW